MLLEPRHAQGLGATPLTFLSQVVKTRLQLQGELVRSGTLSAEAKPYHNSFQALGLVFRGEGVRGIQRGLGAAYIYQVCLNGSRLGFYDPFRNMVGTITGSDGVTARVAAGALAGMSGAALGSPLYLVKTRMQSFSPIFATIGHQHHYKSTASALSSIWKREGVRGLYRGCDAAMARAGVGSAVQLPTYDYSKRFLKTRFNMAEGTGLHFAASMICGFLVCCAMNPFDVISTRMYNQKVDPVTKVGVLYKNPVDCLVKMVQTEGVSGLYKGFAAHYLRIG